jgi:hypothetical protein
MARGWHRLLLVVGLAGASVAAVVGGTAAGAATAPAALPDAATIQREAAQPDPSESVAPPQARPQMHSTLGVVIRVGERRFAIATKSGRHIVGVRPITTIMIDKRKASLDEIKPGDVVLVLGRTGPRGNYIARAVRVVERG